MSPDTLFWLIAVIAFVVLEASTTALVSIWFAVGAAAALIVSFFTQSLSVEAAVFAVVSAVALILMVPTLAKRRKERKAPVTNGSPLTIGKQGVVLVDINPGYLGRVRVDGLDWQARADAAMPKGTPCRVLDVDGAILIVSPVTVETATA
ncbi:MAG TPA: NfeD family protein [Candidatus Gemmiger excrementigallinarum]|uniref:NfeD family protein n=1 Tax=Candidatus Gemmiger excrementigallinarum TaxID=2838609 RepID=A0A9D2ENY8_9FIRM|nr:NfeD family protein [uncultured Subdoligranulum sp.]HIZ41204.1 NfeD family protein [Candidatus Gemmiger excrementigallinarum]